MSKELSRDLKYHIYLHKNNMKQQIRALNIVYKI